MKITRILTPQIVSILFNTTDEEDIAKTTDFLQGIVVETQQNLARDFLLEKGVNQNDIDEFFNNENSQNDQITQLLGTEEMSELYVKAYNSVMDLIYNQQLRTMDDESKEKLNKLLEIEEKSRKLESQTLDIEREVNTLMDDIKKSGQVTQEQIDQALGDAYDRVFNRAKDDANISNQLGNQEGQPIPTDQNQEHINNVSVPESDRPVENVIQTADLPSDLQQVPNTPPVNEPVSPQNMEEVSTNQPYDNPPIPPTT